MARWRRVPPAAGHYATSKCGACAGQMEGHMPAANLWPERAKGEREEVEEGDGQGASTCSAQVETDHQG